MPAVWWELAGATAVALWLTRNFWWPGRYVTAFDNVAYSGPNLEVTLDAWRAGRLPLWNEYIFGGVTHLGNPQAGALYPLRVVALAFDTNRAMGVMVGVHLVLLAVGMVLFVRRLGCRAPAGFVAAVVVCAGGAVLARTLQFEQILVLVWTPWLLLGVTAVLGAARRPYLAMAGTAVVTALVLTAGHPQITYQVAFLGGAWTIASVVAARRQAVGAWSWWRVGDLAGAVVAGAAMAAPQLVAALVATGDSEVGLGRTLAQLESTDLSARPSYLLQILFGTFRDVDDAGFAGGFESIGHVGVAAAALAVVGVVLALHDRTRRPLAVATAVTGVLGLVWAFGPRTVVFRVAYEVLPGFDLARASGRWLDVTAVAAAVGVAFAVDGVRTATRRALVTALAVAAISLAGAAMLAVVDRVLVPDRGTVLAWCLAGAVVLGAVAALAWGRWRVAPIVVVTILSVAVVAELGGTSRVNPIDGLVTGIAFDAYDPGVAGEVADEPGLTMAFTDDAFGDTSYLVAGFRPNTNVLAGVRSLDGYDGGVQITTRFVELAGRQVPNPDPSLPLRNNLPASWTPEQAAAIGVRYVVLDLARDPAAQLPGWVPTGLVDTRFAVWENPAWVADAVVRVPGSPDRPLEMRQPEPGRIEVTTDGGAGTLVVHRQAGPGWEVRVDGRAADLVEVDGFFLGVELPEGATEVVFSYEPGWVLPSLFLATLGLVAVASWVIFGVTRRGGLKSVRYGADGAGVGVDHSSTPPSRSEESPTCPEATDAGSAPPSP